MIIIRNARIIERRGGGFQLNRLAQLFTLAEPSVPRASIVRLARAVNVVRPAARRLHIDRARFAKGGRLGITLAVCMSGLNLSAKPRLFSRGESGIMF